MKLFFGNALWHLVLQSDVMTKFILFALLAVSIVCWSIIFFKTLSFKTKEQQLREIIKQIRGIKTRQDLLDLIKHGQGTFVGHLLSEYSKDLLMAVRKNGTLTARDADYLDTQRFAAIEQVVYEQESYLSVLSTAAAAGPLIGLLGTVWGLTNSFISISEKQSADIVTIAPGMAEALVTTLAGLLVAIPMLVMFHYLNGRVRYIEQLLQRLSDQLQIHVQKLFLEEEEHHESTMVPNEAQKRPFAS